MLFAANNSSTSSFNHLTINLEGRIERTLENVRAIPQAIRNTLQIMREDFGNLVMTPYYYATASYAYDQNVGNSIYWGATGLLNATMSIRKPSIGGAVIGLGIGLVFAYIAATLLFSGQSLPHPVIQNIPGHNWLALDYVKDNITGTGDTFLKFESFNYVTTHPYEEAKYLLYSMNTSIKADSLPVASAHAVSNFHYFTYDTIMNPPYNGVSSLEWWPNVTGTTNVTPIPNTSPSEWLCNISYNTPDLDSIAIATNVSQAADCAAKTGPLSLIVNVADGARSIVSYVPLATP